MTAQERIAELTEALRIAMVYVPHDSDNSDRCRGCRVERIFYSRAPVLEETAP